MSIEDKMRIDERRQHAGKMREHYLQAGRGEWGLLSEEMEAVTERHRQGLVRSMKGSMGRQLCHRQPGGVYGQQVG